MSFKSKSLLARGVSKRKDRDLLLEHVETFLTKSGSAPRKHEGFVAAVLLMYLGGDIAIEQSRAYCFSTCATSTVLNVRTAASPKTGFVFTSTRTITATATDSKAEADLLADAKAISSEVTCD